MNDWDVCCMIDSLVISYSRRTHFSIELIYSWLCTSFPIYLPSSNSFPVMCTVWVGTSTYLYFFLTPRWYIYHAVQATIVGTTFDSCSHFAHQALFIGLIIIHVRNQPKFDWHHDGFCVWCNSNGAHWQSIYNPNAWRRFTNAASFPVSNTQWQ